MMNFKHTVLLFIGVVCSSWSWSQCSFGNEGAEFEKVGSFSPNYILGTKYELGSNKTIESLNLQGLGTLSRVQMALYADSSGIPSKLLATSTIGSVKTGIVSLPIPSTNLKQGDYWIMAIYEETTNRGHTYTSHEIGNEVYYQTVQFGDPLPVSASKFLIYRDQDFPYWATFGAFEGVDVQTACDSFMWIDSVVYTAPNNTAVYRIENGVKNGCDSVLTLNLTFTTIDKSISVNRTQLGSNQANANYQWLDCNKDYIAIDGATSQSFDVLVNGDYAVRITKDGCSDTSECVNVTKTTIGEAANLAKVMVYTNPTSGKVRIDLGKVYTKADLKVYDISGKLVSSLSVESRSEFFYQLPATTGGIYVLKIFVGSNSDMRLPAIRKVILH